MMRTRCVCLLLCMCAGLFTGRLLAQSAYVPLGTNSMYLLDRFEIKSGVLARPSQFNTTARAYQRAAIARYVDSFDVSGANLSTRDYFNLDYLQNENFEWSKSESTLSRWSPARNIYRHKAAFFDYRSTDFNLVVNPVAYLQPGYDTRLKELVYVNSRGLELRGSIRGIVGFYTRFCDEINHTNSWVRDYFVNDTVIPGAGFLKTSDNRTFNYGLASGYLTLQAGRHIDIQFGHGRNFIGNGYRSLYISDFSRDHLFLRINTRIWKVNYTNLWGMMYDYTAPNQRLLPKRHYYAITHASVNVTRNLNIGAFQGIVYQRDSGYASSGPELEYFNPIIFYKTIENGLNSPDKAILGADFKYNFLRHFSLYGQIVISEFVMEHVLKADGWWGNKQAWQLGMKYIDVAGISTLDLQLEYNEARPYMYTSFNRLNAYVNFGQNMAHPLGANFREFISVLRYQPLDRLSLKATGIFTTYGNDTNGSNWGKNIALSYEANPPKNETGNFTGQGVRTNLYFFDLIATYMVKHNVFIDLQGIYRKTGSALAIFDTKAIYGGVALRWNFAERRTDF